MNNLKNRLVLLLGLLALIPLSACGGSDSSTGPGGQRNAPSAITVLADASLKAAFTQLGKQFEAQNSGSTVTFDFGDSTALAQKAAGGGAGDVLTTNNIQAMDTTQSVQLSGPDTFATKGTATYQIVTLKQSKNTSLSNSFISFVTGPNGKEVLAAAGFSAP